MTLTLNGVDAPRGPRTVTDRNLTRLAGLEPGTPAHAALRNEIVEDNLNLVAHACNRYTHRADLREDARSPRSG